MLNRAWNSAWAAVILATVGASAQTIAMVAVEFPKLTEGQADFYVDTKNKALAINAANVAFRSQWAVAEMPFPGAAGTYDIVFHSMYESDGESLYALRVGNDSVGGFQNPSAYTGNVLTTPDYTIYKHTFKKLRVEQGAAIKVYGMTHSNKRVPEAGGFAWSRGRWSRLEFVRNSATGVDGEVALLEPRVSLSRGGRFLSGLGAGRHTVRLMDPVGRQLWAIEAAAESGGSLRLPLDPVSLAPGAYPLVVTGPAGSLQTLMLRITQATQGD